MKKIAIGIAGFIFVLTALYLLVKVPPSEDLIVFGFISLVSFAVFFISQLIFPFKYGLLSFLGVFSFLTINYLAGFQILNTLLLLSVIIGIAFFIQK